MSEGGFMLVHYLEDSRAHRILWLLEELGVDYEIKRYKRGENMSAPAELKQIHPLGKSPIIEDDGRIIAESGAWLSASIGKLFMPQSLMR